MVPGLVACLQASSARYLCRVALLGSTKKLQVCLRSFTAPSLWPPFLTPRCFKLQGCFLLVKIPKASCLPIFLISKPQYKSICYTDSYLPLYMWKTCSEHSHKVRLNTGTSYYKRLPLLCTLWSTLWNSNKKIQFRVWLHIFNTVFVDIRKGKALISRKKSIKHWASLCHVIKCVPHLSIPKHRTAPTR